MNRKQTSGNSKTLGNWYDICNIYEDDISTCRSKDKLFRIKITETIGCIYKQKTENTLFTFTHTRKKKNLGKDSDRLTTHTVNPRWTKDINIES